MLTFPDPNVETEYTDPNGSVWEFNGTGWVRQCDCPDGGGGGSSNDDPHWSNVVLLINGEEGLRDSTGENPIVVTGDVLISNSVVKYGDGSVDVRSTGSYLSIENPPAFNLPFTVETWFYPTYLTTQQVMSFWRNNDKGWTMSIDSSGSLNSSISHDGTNNGGVIGSGNGTVEAGKWHHGALTWDGNTYRIFVDGVMGSTYDSTEAVFYPPTTDLMIGARITTSTPGQYFNGYVDDVRITRGVCRYTEDFAVPPEHPYNKTRYRAADLSAVENADNDSEPLGDDQ